MYIRLIIAGMALLIAGYAWLSARRQLQPAHRLPLDYALGMYTLTYAIGCWILYVYQVDYLFRFYGGGARLPTRADFNLVLWLAFMPYLIVPWSVVMFARFAAIPERRQVRVVPLRSDAVVLACAAVFLLAMGMLAPITPRLISNAIGDLLNTTSAQALYTQRQLVFQDVSFLQGGIIYSVLPALAAILLFWETPHRFVVRFAGASIGIFAILMNLGLFQIGPTLSFLLTGMFCYVARNNGRITFGVTVGASIGVLILVLYSFIKGSGSQVGQLEIFLMRLPIPLPYLIQMSGERASGVADSFNLPFELGEYMFPEFRSAQRFVAMPQPAYVDAWFSYHPLVAILILLFVSWLIVFFGNRLLSFGFGAEKQDSRLLLWAVVAAPTLYYAFQVDIFALFTSAYSCTFVVLPTIAILVVNTLLSGTGVQRKMTS